MENSTGNADKKYLGKQAKVIKQIKNAGTWDKKEKATQEKLTIQL